LGGVIIDDEVVVVVFIPIPEFIPDGIAVTSVVMPIVG
jgi:hypothetical protein